ADRALPHRPARGPHPGARPHPGAAGAWAPRHRSTAPDRPVTRFCWTRTKFGAFFSCEHRTRAATPTRHSSPVLVIAAPGQGAQTPGFLSPWLELPLFRSRFEWLSTVAGLDLVEHGTTSD